jgi:hypothetical protein
MRGMWSASGAQISTAKVCSDRCRDFARREKSAAGALKNVPRYPYSGEPTNPPKKDNVVNILREAKSESTIYLNAPLDILGGGSFRWPGTPALERRTLENIRRSEIGAAS